MLGADGLLTPTTVKQEPDQSLNNTETLASWLNENADIIREGAHEVPETYQGQPFRAGSSLVQAAFKFQAPGVPEDVRAKFAIATCGGCHRTETGTVFLHVENRQVGAPAKLSAFFDNEIAGIRTDDFIELLSMKNYDFMKDGLGKDFGAEKAPKVY